MTGSIFHIAKTRALFGIFLIIILGAPAAMGQSGRSIPKQPKTSATPAPASTPAMTPIAKTGTKPDIVLRVIADFAPDLYFAFPKPESMSTWVMERLRTSPLLDVQNGGLANRRDAIGMAEEGTEAYVVFLQLESDDFGKPDVAGRALAGQIWIRLTVLSPATGKEKYSRKVTLNKELRNTALPPSILRSCHPGIYGNDYLLLEASIEAAEYVMSSFNIPIPPACSR